MWGRLDNFVENSLDIATSFFLNKSFHTITRNRSPDEND
jgi:hypothetical protein